MMAKVECSHSEVVERVGVEQVAECQSCGQIRQFREGKEADGVITKIGRIGQSIVMPPAGHKLLITPEESRLVKQGWEDLNPAYVSVGRWGNEKKEPKVPWLDAEVQSEEDKPEEVTMTRINVHARHEEIEAQKEAIIADYNEFGSAEVQRKYRISTAGLYKVLKEWGVPLSGHRKGKGKQIRQEKPAVLADVKADNKVDYKLKFETYRQAVLDIFGNSGEN